MFCAMTMEPMERYSSFITFSFMHTFGYVFVCAYVNTVVVLAGWFNQIVRYLGVHLFEMSDVRRLCIFAQTNGKQWAKASPSML